MIKSLRMMKYTFLLTVPLLFGFNCYASFESLTNTTDSSESSVASDTQNQPAPSISAPTQFSVYTVASEFINLAWKDNSDNETGFKIFRKTNDSDFVLLNTTSDNVNKYTDDTSLSETTYAYKLSATNAFGDSTCTEEITVTTPSNDASTTPVILYDTPSDWAITEIETAKQYNLTNNNILNDYKKNITREEFCELVVKLYESLCGITADYSSDNFFADTTNVDILKAYNLGIVQGITVDKFEPSKEISRQEICVMIFRTLLVSVPNLNIDTSDVTAFSDENDIASWAINEVRFASKNEIMKGTGTNNINPRSNTTREQAIVLIKRTYESFLKK